MTEQLSYCRICAAACGIIVTVKGDAVVKVRGDVEHPISRGYTCEKGRALPQWHHSSSRLDAPRVRGVEVEWNEALDHLAGILSAVSSADGADAIAHEHEEGIRF